MTKKIELVPAICTQCGGTLDVDPTQEAAVCKFCGSAFIVSKAINNYTVQHAKIEHADNVTIDMKGSVDSVVSFAEREIDKAREMRKEMRKISFEKDKYMFSIFLKLMLGMMIIAVVFWLIASIFNLW